MVATGRQVAAAAVFVVDDDVAAAVDISDEVVKRIDLQTDV